MQLMEVERRLLHRIVVDGPLRLAGQDLEPARTLEERGFIRAVLPRRRAGATPFYVASGAGLVAERDLARAARPALRAEAPGLGMAQRNLPATCIDLAQRSLAIARSGSPSAPA